MSMKQILLATALVLAPLSAANAAQYVVAEARGIGIAVGSVIDPAKPLDLKQGPASGADFRQRADVEKLDGPLSQGTRRRTRRATGRRLRRAGDRRPRPHLGIGTTRGAAPRPAAAAALADRCKRAGQCVPAAESFARAVAPGGDECRRCGDHTCRPELESRNPLARGRKQPQTEGRSGRAWRCVLPSSR